MCADHVCSPFITGGLCPRANNPCLEKPCPWDMQCVSYEASRRPFLCQCPPAKLGECSGVELHGMMRVYFLFLKHLPWSKLHCPGPSKRHLCAHATLFFNCANSANTHPHVYWGLVTAVACATCKHWAPYIKGRP